MNGLNNKDMLLGLRGERRFDSAVFPVTKDNVDEIIRLVRCLTPRGPLRQNVKIRVGDKALYESCIQVYNYQRKKDFFEVSDKFSEMFAGGTYIRLIKCKENGSKITKAYMRNVPDNLTDCMGNALFDYGGDVTASGVVADESRSFYVGNIMFMILAITANMHPEIRKIRNFSIVFRQ